MKAMKEPRRKSKALLELEAAFVERVAEYLRGLGAQQAETSHTRIGFAVQTIAGRLEISVYPEFIACRFVDVDRARATVVGGRLNPHSGKWNFGQGELFDTTVVTRPAVEARVFTEFSSALTAIVQPGPVDPPPPYPGTIADLLTRKDIET